MERSGPPSITALCGTSRDKRASEAPSVYRVGRAGLFRPSASDVKRRAAAIILLRGVALSRKRGVGPTKRRVAPCRPTSTSIVLLESGAFSATTVSEVEVVATGVHNAPTEDGGPVSVACSTLLKSRLPRVSVDFRAGAVSAVGREMESTRLNCSSRR